MAKSDPRLFLDYLAAERNASLLYRALADTVQGDRREALLELADIEDKHAEHWADRPPRIFFEDLAPDSLTLVAHTWHHPPDFWALCATHDRINLQILKRFGEEGIEFAFPTTTTVLEAGSTPITIQLSSPVPGTAAPQPVAPV